MINIHSAAPSILRSPAALVVLDKPSLCLVVLDIRARVAKPWGFEDSVAGARLARLAEIVLAYLQVVETHVGGFPSHLGEDFRGTRHSFMVSILAPRDQIKKPPGLARLAVFIGRSR
jgi:hypothetical protein